MEEVGIKLVAADGTTFTGTLKQAEAATDSFVKTTETSGPRVSRAGEIISGAFAKIGALAVSAALEAGKALVKFGVDSIKVAGDFEAGMGKFAAVAGDFSDTGLTVDDFRKKFLQLGKDTAFSAGEAQTAMTELIKGGVNVKDAYGDATQATLDLAAATKMDLGQAAEIVAKQLGVWSDKGLTATRAVDLLNQAADASTVNVDDLALGLANAGGTAKTAGVSYEDLVQTMAQIAPNFSSASDAGTSFKTFLSRLIPSTDAQTEAMISLGLATTDGKSAFYDAQGQFIGMEKAAGLLQSATKDLTEEQKLSYLQTIFGSDAIRAAAAIATGGAEGFNAMGDAMDKQGTASQKAATLNKGFNFAMEQLSGSLETLQIIIGSALLPILTELLNNYIVPAVNNVMAFAESFINAGDKVSFLAGILGGFGEPASEVTETFEYVQTTISKVMAGIQSVVGEVLGVITEFWARNGETILEDVEDIWIEVTGVIGLAMTLINATIVPALKAIAKFIDQNGDDIIKILRNAWTIIKAVIDTALALITGIIKVFIFVVKGDWANAWEAIKLTINTVIYQIKIIISTVLDQIKLVISLVLTAILGDVEAKWTSIKTTIANTLAAMKAAVVEKMEEIATTITTAVSNAITGIENQFENFVNAGRNLINKIVSGVQGVANNIRLEIESAVSKALEINTGIWDTIFAFGGDIIDKIVSGITGSATAIYNAVWNAVSSAIEAAKNLILGFINNPLGFLGGGGGGGDDGQGPDNFKGNRVSTPATAAQTASTTYAQTYSRTYQLSVNTNQPAASVIHQYNVMRALAL